MENCNESRISCTSTTGYMTLVLAPKDAPIIGCKWVYKTKTHSNGKVASYKARLVALGNK